MVNIEYSNAYSEVLEILKYISVEDYKKIPKSKIEIFQKNANKDYIFKYTPEKTLDEQNVSKRAKAIIGLLFRDYWSTERQRDMIIRKQNFERHRIEEHKKALYNIDNIFENKKEPMQGNKEDKENKINELVVYKESLFKKCIKKIITFLKKG